MRVPPITFHGKNLATFPGLLATPTKLGPQTVLSLRRDINPGPRLCSPLTYKAWSLRARRLARKSRTAMLSADGSRARGSAGPLGFPPSPHDWRSSFRSLAPRLLLSFTLACALWQAMPPPALPLFLLSLLCACSWIFAAASPILLLNAEKTPERNASSSPSLLTRQNVVPLYRRCEQEGHFAMTFDDGPVRCQVPIHSSLPRMSLDTNTSRRGLSGSGVSRI